MKEVRQYCMLDVLGSGSFSTVYKAKNTKTEQMVALKAMKELDRNDVKVVQNEINLMKKIDHKNVVKCYDDFKDQGKWYIVLEYCGRGDLDSFRKKQQQQALPQPLAKNIINSIADALLCIHQLGIVHRDLKLANILVNENYQIKLADFGFSKDTEGALMTSYCGTPLTMSPQILKKQQYDEKCDVWSLGVLAYQLIYGKNPFSPSEKFGRGIVGLTKCVLESQPQYPQSASAQCIEFIKGCFKKNSKKRPSIKEIKSKYSWLHYGIQSTLRREGLEARMENLSETSEKLSNIIQRSTEKHVKSIFQKIGLSSTLFQKHFKHLKQNFSQEKKLQVHYLLMGLKIYSQLKEKEAHIFLDDILKLSLGLKDLKSFKKHLDQLKNFIKEELIELGEETAAEEQKGSVYLEKQLIYFCHQQLKQYYQKDLLGDMSLENKKFFTYLSKLPLSNIKDSCIKFKWVHDPEADQEYRKIIQVLKSWNSQELLEASQRESYNQDDVSDRQQSNWLIEEEINTEYRQGDEIIIGKAESEVFASILMQ